MSGEEDGAVSDACSTAWWYCTGLAYFRASNPVVLCFHTLGSTNEENVSQVVHSALDGKHGGAQRWCILHPQTIRVRLDGDLSTLSCECPCSLRGGWT